jgi:hypothetical protein
MEAKNVRPMTATGVAKRGTRKSRTSSDGNCTRRSYQTKAARTARPPTMDTQTSARSKPCSPPSMMP